jgi:3-hydroxyacyl-CoA dehydrogenase
MPINNIFIVGAGFMGNGIAQVAAVSGCKVKMNDVSEERVQAGLNEIKRSLGKLLSKAKISQDGHDQAIANLNITTRFEDAEDADLAVEAVPEKLELKKDIFARLDRVCPSHTVFGTNTSALSISSIASGTARPDKVIGTHFFGPVPLMKLCEITRGLLTSDHTAAVAAQWVKRLSKEAVMVNKDHAGFIANRVTLPGTLEAIKMVAERTATPEQVDRASGDFEAGIGPLQICDNAGLDVVYNATMAVYEDTKDPKFLPSLLLKDLIDRGLTGRKTGKGFYDYKSGKRESYDQLDGNPRGGAADRERLLMRYHLPAILESIRALEAGVASAEDIDKAVRLGLNYPQGRLEIADARGLDEIAELAMGFYHETGDVQFFPPPLLRRMIAAGLLGKKTGRGFFKYAASN